MNPQVDSQHSGTTLRDALAVMRRRKVILILCALLVPATAFAFSLVQVPAYQGQADVLLSQKNLANSLTNLQDQSVQAVNADRVAQTQAELARTPEVAGNTLKALNIDDMTTTELLEQSSVTSSQNSDILVFKVTDENQLRARQLVNEYAKQYTEFRTKLDTASAARALSEVNRQLNPEDGKAATGSLRSTLLDKREELKTLMALQTSNSFVVRTETKAEQVRPTPIRNTVLGLVLGLMLGTALAFALDAVDTRLRTAEEIAEALQTPLLVRIPLEKKRRESTLPLMLADPGSPDTEAYRLLRSNLEFSTVGGEIRTMMFTSAVENEGKSTTAANLAIAYALAGRNVCLIDLDLRRPSLEHTFDLLPRPGVTNIAVGETTLRQALIRLRLGGTTGASANGGTEGGLWLLPGGGIPPDPGEFISTRALGTILTQLRDSFDLVLIDTSPMLRVGDPMSLAKHVDGIVVVGRRGVLHQGMAREMRRLLDAAPARTLGVVAVGGAVDKGYGYGYASGDGYIKGSYPTIAEQQPGVTV